MDEYVLSTIHFSLVPSQSFSSFLLSYTYQHLVLMNRIAGSCANNLLYISYGIVIIEELGRVECWSLGLTLI